MKDEVKKTKITVICNGCDKPFTTNIGWAAKRGNNLTCSKCSGDKITIGDDVDINDAIEVLKKHGINIK